MSALQSVAGVAVFRAGVGGGRPREAVRWRQVGAGLALQCLLAALLLGAPGTRQVFELLARAVGALQASSLAATSFVFGYVGAGPAPFAIVEPSHQFVLAFQSLPMVLVIGAPTSLLVYRRVLPLAVGAFGRVVERALGIGGAVGFGAAANVFLGSAGRWRPARA
jgi:CNT family concentrative nucleoside transporter